MMDLSEIIFSEEIYPRDKCDWRTVVGYADAMLAGAEFPPAVAVQDGEVTYLLDGWHRCKAWKQVGRDSIPVIVRTDLARKEWLAEAARLNAVHGKPFTVSERTNLVLRLRKIGFADKKIAGALSISMEWVYELAERAVISDKATGSGIALKPALLEVKPVVQKALDSKKPELNIEGMQKRMSGQKQFVMIRQVVELAEHKLLNLDDERVVEWLKRLKVVVCDLKI
jgi:hypothetical protein